MQIEAVVLFLLLIWADLSCCCLGWGALLVAWRWEKCLHGRLLRLIQVIIDPAISDRQGSLLWIVFKAQWCWIKALPLSIDSNWGCRYASIQIAKGRWLRLPSVQLESSVLFEGHCKVANRLVIIQSGLQEQKPLEEKNVACRGCASLRLR